MHNFRIIYRILTKYKELLETPGNPAELITPDTLDTTEHHMKTLLVMLSDAGLLKGITDNGGADVAYRHSEITLKGLEYLADNTKMKEISQELKK